MQENLTSIERRLIDRLNDDEIEKLINSMPVEGIISIVKSNPKRFKKDTEGCIISPKSNMLINRIKKRLLKGYLEKDLVSIEILDEYANILVKSIKNRVENEVDEEFLFKTLKSNDINDFATLIDIISIALKNEYICLFFKLIDNSLTVEQQDYITLDLKVNQKVKAKCQEIEKEICDKFEVKLAEVCSKHKEEIEKINLIKKQIQEQLDAVNQNLIAEKKHVENYKKKIDELNEYETKKEQEFKEKLQQLEYKSNDLEELKNNLIKTIEDKEFIIEQLKSLLENKFNNFSDEANKKWEQENQSKMDEYIKLKGEYEKLKEKTKETSEEINGLEKAKIQLKNKIAQYNLTIDQFIKNIDSKIIENALSQSLLKFETCSKNESISMFPRPCIKENIKSNKIERCKGIHDFSMNIADNLESIGVSNKNNTDCIANYIIGIFASGMIPIIRGYKAREIATAIGAAYSGETPYIITLPNGYSNPDELIRLFNLADTNVVLIEEAIGTMNENSLLPLLREKVAEEMPYKLLILATENEDSLKYMPRNILNYLAIVNVNKIKIFSKKNLGFYDSREVFIEFKKQLVDSVKQKTLKSCLRI